MKDFEALGILSRLKLRLVAGKSGWREDYDVVELHLVFRGIEDGEERVLDTVRVQLPLDQYQLKKFGGQK